MLLYTLSVWLHIVAATAWVGAMIFFAAVVVPVLRRPQLREIAPELLRAVGARFRALGWVSLVALVVTGITNLASRGIGWTMLVSEQFRGTAFGRAFAWKMVFVLLVIAATAAHDLLSGESAMRRLAADPRSAEAVRARRTASWLGRGTLLLSLAVLYFAVALVRGLP